MALLVELELERVDTLEIRAERPRQELGMLGVVASSVSSSGSSSSLPLVAAVLLEVELTVAAERVEHPRSV